MGTCDARPEPRKSRLAREILVSRVAALKCSKLLKFAPLGPKIGPIFLKFACKKLDTVKWKIKLKFRSPKFGSTFFILKRKSAVHTVKLLKIVLKRRYARFQGNRRRDANLSEKSETRRLRDRLEARSEARAGKFFEATARQAAFFASYRLTWTSNFEVFSTQNFLFL